MAAFPVGFLPDSRCLVFACCKAHSRVQGTPDQTRTERMFMSHLTNYINKGNEIHDFLKKIMVQKSGSGKRYFASLQRSVVSRNTATSLQRYYLQSGRLRY